MKKIFAILTTVVLFLNVTACSTEQPKDEDVSGSENTVVSDTENTETTAEVNPYDIYIGTWAEEDIGWEHGGLIMDISIENEEMNIACSRTQAAPISRVAEIKSTFNLSEIKDSVVEVKYDNDGWGNSGTMEITFNQSAIFCSFKDVVTNSIATWGFYEQTYKLISNEKAYELMVYTQEEFDEKYHQTETVEQPEDNESDDMTIEDIRNNSLMLEWTSSRSDFDYKTTLNPCKRSELKNNPDSYIGQYFVPCETLTEYIVCPECMGSGFYHGIAEKGGCYNKGYRSMDKTENGTHYILQEYLDQAALKPISISDVFVDVTGATVYEYDPPKDHFIDYIYDMREDKSIPITEDTYFVPYMVFLGEVDGHLNFGLIDCDIIQ